MSTWRFIEPETKAASANMAIDEALLHARINGKTPNTVRLYCWRPSAVTIGRFQSVHDVVNLENCKANGVDVVRRISGGGAVYHDSEGELTYSVIVRRADLGTADVAKAYNLICGGLIRAARYLGVSAEYKVGSPKHCPNVTVQTKKISGSAQAIKRGVILQHGTLLMNVDLKRMFRFLKAPTRSSEAEIVGIAKRKITSVEDELGRPASIAQACEALRKGFKEALNAEFREAKLNNYELRLAEELEKFKFSVEKWNLEGRSCS
jgi:lipoate-protein ligase A